MNQSVSALFIRSNKRSETAVARSTRERQHWVCFLKRFVFTLSIRTRILLNPQIPCFMLTHWRQRFGAALWLIYPHKLSFFLRLFVVKFPTRGDMQTWGKWNYHKHDLSPAGLRTRREFDGQCSLWRANARPSTVNLANWDTIQLV